MHYLPTVNWPKGLTYFQLLGKFAFLIAFQDHREQEQSACNLKLGVDELDLVWEE